MTVLLPRDRRRSRFLFDWSARWALERNSLDAITGQTATFARADVGTAIGSAGRVQQLAYAQPRFQWVDLDGDGVRESPLLLLEDGRTNLVVQSDALASGWTTGGGATVANAVGTYANRPFSRATGGMGAQVYRAVTFTGNGTKAFSLLLKSDGAAGVGYVSLFDSTAAQNRAVLRYVVASGGSITATCTVGTLLQTELLGDGVYRFHISAPSCLAASVNQVYAFATAGDATLTTVLVSGIQIENAPSPSSLIPTTTATLARAADTLSFGFSVRPQAMTVYVRSVTLSTDFSGNPYWLDIGSTATTDHFYLLPGAAGSAFAQFFNDLGAGGTSFASVSPTQGYGDAIEVAGIMTAAGAAQVRAAKNGGTVLDSGVGTAVALPTAWSAATLRLNAADSGNGLSAFHSVRVAAGVQSLAFMRAG
jgi:hypothetical protein